LHCTLAFH